jgi:hypothetical protein
MLKLDEYGEKAADDAQPCSEFSSYAELMLLTTNQSLSTSVHQLNGLFLRDVSESQICQYFATVLCRR